MVYAPAEDVGGGGEVNQGWGGGATSNNNWVRIGAVPTEMIEVMRHTPFDHILSRNHGSGNVERKIKGKNVRHNTVHR